MGCTFRVICGLILWLITVLVTLPQLVYSNTWPSVISVWVRITLRIRNPKIIDVNTKSQLALAMYYEGE